MSAMGETPVNASPSAPRLGVVHLLLWMLGCAGAATGLRLFFDWSTVPAEQVNYYRLLHLGASMAYGVTLVTMYVLASSLWRRDGAFPSQPGHWLLLLGMAAALLEGAATGVVRWCIARGILSKWEEWWVIQWSGWAVGAAIIAAVLASARMEWRWRAPIAVLLLMALSHSATTFLVWRGGRSGVVLLSPESSAHLHAAWMALGAPVLVAAAAGDLLMHKRRDWLHWTGFAVWAGLATIEAVNYFRFWVLV